jgi:hypothetical protein
MPRWERVLWQAAYSTVMLFLFFWTLSVVALFAIGWAASRLLPSSWRTEWLTPLVPDLPPAADCPACRSPLTVESPIGTRQRGVCPNCGCVAVRTCHHLTFGSVWFPWKPDNTEPPAGPQT